MTTDPLKKPDKILQKISNEGDLKQSITLIDIDYSIMRYLEDVALPKLDENGNSLTIPVVYGNSERWNAARRDGVYRDKKGKIQLPLVMLKRSTVAKNTSMPIFNRQVSYSTIKKYSKDNRYDRFSILSSNTRPKYELYDITMPDYIEITYNCIAWTDYTEQLNTIIESMTFASDEYWGEKTKYKFNTIASDFDITSEVANGSERVNRVQFNLSVKAYLLPAKYDGQSTTKKSYNTVRIVTGETDVTAAGRLEQILITPSPYYDNKDLVDFLALNSSITKLPTVNDTITFNSIKLIPTPTALISSITSTMTIDSVEYDVKLYINGIRYYQTSHFTAVYGVDTNILVITFIPANLGFTITPADEITISGKFIEL